MTVKRGEIVNDLLMKRIIEKAAVGNARMLSPVRRAESEISSMETVRGAEQLRLSISSHSKVMEVTPHPSHSSSSSSIAAA